MNLSALFAKPIERDIEGVIKADDDSSLHLEVEEYVLTREVAKRLDSFLKAYNEYDGGNGVWISGFFGSGKSHLLKMLALLLENGQIDGDRVLDLFLHKDAIQQDPLLRAELQRAVAIPSKSILFNIDQKADVISKQQFDALLAVFVKVFDEMCGYYGKQGYIAQFERDLDNRGQYVAFQDAFATIAGYDWSVGREQTLLEEHNIAQAYSQVTGVPAASAVGVMDKYRSDYRVSIEDFAATVQSYIERQGSNFRLNFFVDEVGQYIADNVKLMTNLQTIAESLATHCRGRAWLLVTAQEDMATVVGEVGKQQSNDFSKIQARFKNRMKLTSQDVEEVIRQRLLRKKDQHVALLTTLYEEQQNNFKTLFTFADGAPSNRTYRDHDHFIHTYPFVPYQFVLFQSAIENLSLHNAFEGKHSSVGERSMLEVFQAVAIAIGATPVGHLATFDRMFDGIRSTLKTQVQRSILNAENQLDDQFAIRLLKALFLVKYIKEFKATARNLTVLMYERFDSDLPALRERVATALNLLEQATYVQRNGEIYQYLTDEEKDIEEEIKGTEVDNAAVAEELARIIFDGVLRGRRIRYEENGQDYAFGRKLDDRLLGREQELTIHVASPFHEHFGNELILRSQSMGRDELLVILPPHPRLRTDLVMYKRTEKYIRQTVSVAQQESTRRILAAKQTQNRERLATVETLVDELLGEAQLIVEGEELAINHGDAQTRLIKGFHHLIARTYPNLRMLRGTNYSENDIPTLLQQGATLFGNDDATEGATVSEAERDMRGFIGANKRNGLRTSMTVLLSHFTRKPYGWHQAAVQCLLAKLIARNWVEVRQDSTLLDTADRLAHALRNSRDFANLLFEPQIEFTAAQTRSLRDFYADFFDGPPVATEAKALAQETAQALVALHDELTRHRARAGDYPFLTALDAPLALLAGVIDRPYDFYLTELRRHEDDLFQAKEDLIAPLRQLMAPNSAQRTIYDDSRTFLARQEPNLSYIEGTAATELRGLLADPACFRGNKLQGMKRLLDTLRERVQAAVSAERARQQAAVQQRWERLAIMDDFQALTADQQAQLQAPFTELQDSLARQDLIAVIRDSVRRFDDRRYQELLRQMTMWAAPPAMHGADDGKRGGEGEINGVAEPPVEYVIQRTLQVNFTKAWLADANDVDDYLAALRDALLHQIEQGKRIQL